MRYLFLALLFTQTALADPPSFWMRASPNKYEGLLALQEAQFAYRSQDFDQALTLAKIARAQAPSVEADYVYGLSLFRSSFTFGLVDTTCAEALTLLQGVQERSARLGDEPEMHLAIGLCAAVTGEYLLAIEENSLLAYYPNAKPEMQFLGFMNLGDSQMAAGHLDEAIAAYTEAYLRVPGEPYVSFAMAVACYRNHDLRAAMTALQRALAMDPLLETLEDTNIIFVPAEDKLFFLALGAAGNRELELAYSYLLEYLSIAPEGLYRGRAMEAISDVEAFSQQLTGEVSAAPLRRTPPLSKRATGGGIFLPKGQRPTP
jgi:tetratricopeptide (TPR) repeat protein